MKKGKKMKHELSDINPQKMDSQKWDMLLGSPGASRKVFRNPEG